ncbi:MAG: D-cysteine desulfhydrase family protein [Deltaproteobacteria bacterium]|nr:MAG: D-cysteine desulfhydrase family protein [Deltaproteobacteria bacterium]
MDKLSLARLPTPLEPAPRLSEWVGAEVWVKRDDLTGLGISGNKVRKLEYLLADAQAQGADGVATCGGLQSNHCRATAVAARRLGLDPLLLLRGEAPAEPDGNLLLDTLLDAEVHFCTPEAYASSRGALLEGHRARWAAEGRHLYVIPEGGSNALGCEGYIAAAAEVANEAFDHHIVAVGSGGTLAGLVLGPDIGEVVGIAVCDSARFFVDKVHALAAELGRSPQGAWRVSDDYIGPGYSLAHEPVWQAIREAARREGLFLDPAYTGKALWGLREEVAAGRMGGRVCFWHTGGAFGLFGRGGEL